MIGGYDTTRINGDLVSFPTYEDCSTCVTITEMTWQWEGGATSLFSNSSEVLQVSLNPFTRGLEFPQHLYDNFLGATQGAYSSSLGGWWPADNAPTGNISVTLKNGYKTTIPSNELFTTPRLYNKEGVYSISNNTVKISTVSNSTDPGYIASWGIPYLTMNYMVMDYENEQFQMAPALRQDFGDTGGALIHTVCAAAPTSTPTSSSISNPTASTATTSSAASEHGSKSNTGAIVGGVIGGVAALLILAGVIVFFLWRRHRQKKKQKRNTQMQAAGHGHAMTVEGMSQAGDQSRASMWTSTAPTVYSAGHSELASPEVKQGSPYVNQWLSSQDRIDEVSVDDSGRRYRIANVVQVAGHGAKPHPVEMATNRYSG